MYISCNVIHIATLYIHYIYYLHCVKYAGQSDAKQKHLGCKKADADQMQQSSDYTCD